jgi:hypothetical protein
VEYIWISRNILAPLYQLQRLSTESRTMLRKIERKYFVVLLEKRSHESAPVYSSVALLLMSVQTYICIIFVAIWKLFRRLGLLILLIHISKRFAYFCQFMLGGDRLCGLVVRVPGYRSRGPRFDSRRYQICWIPSVSWG